MAGPNSESESSRRADQSDVDSLYNMTPKPTNKRQKQRISYPIESDSDDSEVMGEVEFRHRSLTRDGGQEDEWDPHKSDTA